MKLIKLVLGAVALTSLNGCVSSKAAKKDTPLPTDDVDTTLPNDEDYNRELARMQEIEPGFIPKDARALQLFLLQRLATENDAALKQRSEQRAASRAADLQKFRDDLGRFVENRTGRLDEKRETFTDEAIKQYEQVLENHGANKDLAPDIMYRLGQFYFERDEKEYFAKLAAYNDAHEKGETDVPYPDENFGRTIKLYEKILASYPSYQQSDSVYYLLALGLWYEGDFTAAVRRFEQLVDKYPQSRHAEEVWFRLGEYNYDMDRFDAALANYRRAAQNPDSALYDKAIYKIAWCYYQKDRYKDAVDNFMRVLEITWTDKDDSATASLRAEVTRYIVKSMMEKLVLDDSSKGYNADEPADIREEKLGVKLSERVAKFLDSKNNPPYGRGILIETASQMLDEAKVDGAVLALSRVIELDANHDDNPRIASQIVDVLQESDRGEEARTKSLELIEVYRKNGPWFTSHDGNYVAQSHAREAVRDAMLALAVYHHRLGKDQKEAGDAQAAQDNFTRAAELYAEYVREYPERDDTYKAIFYLAESAFELNRYRLALDAYQLLKDYPLPMPDDTRRNATFNIVYTFRHVLESEAREGRFKTIDFDTLTSKSKGTTKEEIPDTGIKYLASIEDFLRVAPQDPQVPVLLFHRAAIFYVYGHVDDALVGLNFIIDTYPQTQVAAVAARLIVDDAVTKEDWATVVALSAQFKEKNIGGSAADFGRMEAGAKFKIARGVYEQANELLQSNQLQLAKLKFKESAALFSALLAEDAKNPNADIMLFNSARATVLSGTSTAALPLYRRLYRDYPKSKFAATARFQEALLLEKMLKFSEAALAYDGIIKQDPQSETAADAMLNKALLYEAADDLPKAAAAFVEFAKRYPDRAEAADAYLTAAALYKKMGNVNQQIAMLSLFVKQYRQDADRIPAVIEAHVQIAETYAQLGRTSTSAKLKTDYEKLRRSNYQSAVALYGPDLGSATAAYFAAQAQLILGKQEQDDFKKLTINAKSGKAQGEQLTAMMSKLNDLSTKNEAVIKNYAVAVWNAEALRRIGVLYEHLANRMARAPCPRDVEEVDEFACEEYAVLLEDKAAVLEEKALGAYRQAYEIALSANDVPANLVTDILAGLNRLRPGEYQRVGNLIEQPQSFGFYGQGRMLSSGKMASSLHEKENDPDVPKAPPKELPPPAPIIDEGEKDLGEDAP